MNKAKDEQVKFEDNAFRSDMVQLVLCFISILIIGCTENLCVGLYVAAFVADMIAIGMEVYRCHITWYVVVTQSNGKDIS